MAALVGRIKLFLAARSGPALDRSWIEATTDEVAAGGVPSPIMPFGVLPVSIAANAGATVRYRFDETTNSQQAAYNKLVNSIVGSTKSASCDRQTVGHCDIEEYATLSGILLGYINTVSSMNWNIDCRRDTDGNAADAHIEMKIYHRDDFNEIETLLDTVETGNLTTTYVDETGTWTPSSTSPEFTGTSMLVVKMRLHNTGTPP